MNFLVCNTYEEVSQEAAKIFEAQLRQKPDSVLGLATGSTPVGTYQQLIKWYEKGDFHKMYFASVDKIYQKKS